MRILYLFIVIISFSRLEACDGCNISTGYINVDPVNYVSLRHRNVYYKGEEISFFRHTGHGGQLSENYLSHEFLAKYFAFNKFYLKTLISFKESVVFSQDIDQKISGFSDPIFLVGYQNLAIFKKWQFNYNIFGGFDIGIGEYNNDLHEEYSAGNKASDFLLGSEFLVRFDRFGMLSKVNYKVGFKNKFGYQFGQIINSNVYAAYFHERGNLMTIPLVGLSFESDFIDFKNNRSVRFSSSNILFADFGLNIMFSERFILGSKYKIPVFKNVPGWAELSIDAFEFELSFVLGK